MSSKNTGTVTDIAAYSGFIKLNRRNLEKLKAEGRKARINVAGLLIISKDVPLELALETIESVNVHGVIKASPEIKNMLRRI